MPTCEIYYDKIFNIKQALAEIPQVLVDLTEKYLQKFFQIFIPISVQSFEAHFGVGGAC